MDARRNIDAWWPHVEAGAEAVVVTASGCGAHVREYAHLLEADPDYAKKAARVTLLARDVARGAVAAEQDGAAAAAGERGVPRPSPQPSLRKDGERSPSTRPAACSTA
jgi:glycolate oxidase iron-sulfur subunit